MNRYTLDAQGLLYYLVDALPGRVDEIFDRANDGDAVILLPTIAAAEATYKVQKNDTVRGIPLAAGPRDLVTAITEFFPVSVVGLGPAELQLLPDWMDEFPSQIHDAMVLSFHESASSDAVITADPKLAEHVSTIWE